MDPQSLGVRILGCLSSAEPITLVVSIRLPGCFEPDPTTPSGPVCGFRGFDICGQLLSCAVEDGQSYTVRIATPCDLISVLSGDTSMKLTCTS